MSNMNDEYGEIPWNTNYAYKVTGDDVYCPTLRCNVGKLVNGHVVFNEFGKDDNKNARIKLAETMHAMSNKMRRLNRIKDIIDDDIRHKFSYGFEHSEEPFYMEIMEQDDNYMNKFADELKELHHDCKYLYLIICYKRYDVIGSNHIHLVVFN